MHVGVISDTHGLLRPEVLAALAGSDLIVHAGDVGGQDILDALGEIAPVYPVRGNTDGGPYADRLPMTQAVQVGSLWLYVLHELDFLDLVPQEAGFAAVVFGHTHRPHQETRHGVLFFNPGSAGPRRQDLPVSVGRLVLENGRLSTNTIEIKV